MTRALSLVLFCGVLNAATVKFNSRETLNQYQLSPTQVLEGDFNKDGKPDLVVLGGGTLSLYLNLGRAQFGTPTVLRTNSYYTAAVVADFNHDGNLDIALLYSPFPAAPGSVTIFLGNGNGTFQSPIVVTTQDSPAGLIAGDFNHDGHLDFAVGGASVQVFLGNGEGGFSAPVNTPLNGITVYSFAAADFNLDGNLDLTICSNSNDTVSLYLGNGNGTFQAPSASLTSGNYATAAAGDLNGDKNPDLVVSTGLGSLTDLVFIGNGNGTFQPPVSYQLPRYGATVAIRDVNGDGSPDIVAGCSEYDISQGGALSVFLNNGNGTFQSAINSLVGTDVTTVALADYNGDGHLDLAFASDFSIGISLGNGKGDFQSATNYAAVGNPGQIFAANFQDTGLLDILALAGVLNLYPGEAEGRFGKDRRHPANSVSAPSEISITMVSRTSWASAQAALDPIRCRYSLARQMPD
jgi:FG-GAP-like repeat